MRDISKLQFHGWYAWNYMRHLSLLFMICVKRTTFHYQASKILLHKKYKGLYFFTFFFEQNLQVPIPYTNDSLNKWVDSYQFAYW